VFIVMNSRKNRRSKGASMAELPAVLYLLFIGLIVPMVAMAVFSYRVSLAYFAARNAASQAARAATFTAATAAATTAWTTDTGAWNGISPVTENLYIVTHQIIDAGSSGSGTDGTETVSSTKLTQGTVNVAQNVYFYRTVCVVTIAPWFSGKWFGLKIPMITAPYNLMLNYQEVVENTAGLTS
jgi:hypothetical protein